MKNDTRGSRLSKVRSGERTVLTLPRYHATKPGKCRNCWDPIGVGDTIHEDSKGAIAFHAGCPSAITPFPEIVPMPDLPDNPYARRRFERMHGI